MRDVETIVLNRDCEAHLIPSGDKVTLKEGIMVQITQSLGGSFTLNVHGNLVRVAGENADALGKEIPEQPEPQITGDGLLEENDVWEVLKTCYDPEIPVDIVNLGLIYELNIEQKQDEGARVVVVMTLTAPGCGMGPILAAEVEDKIRVMPNVREVAVQMVFDPPWSYDMLSDEAKLKLGML